MESNMLSDKYSKHESIAGKDPWYKVLGYRILMLGVDFLSLAAVFAACSTWMLFKFYTELEFLITHDAKASVVVAFLALGMLQVCAWIMAFVYYCMRKYTPPIVAAIATRIAGNAKDFQLTDKISESDSEQKILLEMPEPPKPVDPKGWDQIVKKVENIVKNKL
jgi:hypothetical protein